MSIESRGISGADYRTTSTETHDLAKVLIGALAGAAVGSLIAGAFTEKGIEIRNRVGESSKNIANNLKHKVSDKVSDVKDAVADKFEAAKDGAANLIEKGKQKVGLSSSGNDYKSGTGYAGNTAYSIPSETDESGAGSKILLGALIVSVASTLVWSFATEKGNQTRRRIARGSKNMATNVKEKVSDVAGDIAQGVSKVYETAKEGAADLIEQQKQKINTPASSPSYRSSEGADNW